MVIYLLHEFISYIPFTLGSCNREKIVGYFVELEMALRLGISLYLKHVYEILDVFKGTEHRKN